MGISQPVSASSGEPILTMDVTAADSRRYRLLLTEHCKPILRTISWRLLPFLFLLYIVSYLDRINVSFAGLQMNRDLGFSDTVFGFGAGIFFIGYFMFGIPSNLMVARMGARRWIAIIMVIWGAISVSMALVNTQGAFYAMRFLLGIAEAGFFPGIILYLTYWFPKREHGSAVARFMSAIPVAGIVGGLVSSQLLQLNGVLGIAGWKWLFIATGLPSVLLGIVVWFYLTDRPQTAEWLSDEQKSNLLDLLKQDHNQVQARNQDQRESGGTGPTSAVVWNFRVWQYATIYFCLTLAMYGYQMWLPQIIRNFGGLSTSQTAMLTIFPAIFQAIGMICIARNSDRTGERRTHLAASAAFAASSLIASTMFHNAFLSLAFLSVTALGIWGTVGPFWAMPTAALSPRNAAAGIALINSVGNLGGFVGPTLIGIVQSEFGSVHSGLDVMAISLLLAGILTMMSPKATRTEETALH